MIPKIIHYCWFGKNPKSETTILYINLWKKILPEYEIIEWNEDNCDISNAPKFVREAYNRKKWAFVSDYFRLKALYQHGGIYLDTDIELLKDFNQFLNNDFFCCFESENTICTAVIGAKKNSEIILKLIELYEKFDYSEKPNSFLFFEYLIKGKSVDVNKQLLISEKVTIYPFYYFSPINYYTGKLCLAPETIAIHHFESTWKNKRGKFFDSIKRIIYKIVGQKNYNKVKDFIKRRKK